MEEVTEKIQDTWEGQCLPAGLGALEELGKVARERALVVEDTWLT